MQFSASIELRLRFSQWDFSAVFSPSWGPSLCFSSDVPSFLSHECLQNVLFYQNYAYFPPQSAPTIGWIFRLTAVSLLLIISSLPLIISRHLPLHAHNGLHRLALLFHEGRVRSRPQSGCLPSSVFWLLQLFPISSGFFWFSLLLPSSSDRMVGFSEITASSVHNRH